MSKEKYEIKTVLMVEDDANLLKLNTEILSRNGYNVCSAKNLSEARKNLNDKNIDIAVLDIVLPDGDGLLFASEVKAKVNCPVLMLTSKNEHDDIVKGMSSDADMYMTKPFLIPELIARIEGLLKKQQLNASKPLENIYKLGSEFTFDTITRKATLHGENLNLSPNDFTLLLIMAKNEEKATKSDVLYEKVWNQALSSDTSSLRSAIARLRKKLQDSSYTINAVRGEGYILEKW